MTEADRGENRTTEADLHTPGAQMGLAPVPGKKGGSKQKWWLQTKMATPGAVLTPAPDTET